jgi:uncharacterized protein YbaR (Trm112 family)
VDSGQPLRQSDGVKPVLDENVLRQLACPACAGDLRVDASHLRCIACERAYPVIDGIPVLIVERAEQIPHQSELASD